MRFFPRALFMAFLPLCLLFNACASGGHAPVVAPADRKPPAKTVTSTPVQQPRPASARPALYTVKRGDTLYSIAWNYGIDYRQVAAWNGIRSPYTIYPGQRIKLQPATRKPTPQQKPATQSRAEPLTPGPIVTRQTGDGAEAISAPGKKPPQPELPRETATATITDPEPLPNVAGPGQWIWPATGKIEKNNTPISKNGIDITGIIGQGINAAAPGEVVYSGSGLLGYGRLIIIKHNDTYLSAYAHNKELLVKEGDKVTAGQKIALMGQTSNGRALLHFEIRKNGQPVDPLDYLPRR